MARVCEAQREYEVALEHWNACLKVYPESPPALWGSAKSYFELGRYEESYTAYKKVLEYTVGEMNAIKRTLDQDLVELAEAKGEWKRGIFARIDANSNRFRVESLLGLAILDLEAERPLSAEAHCAQGLLLDPENEELLYYHGTALSELDRFEEARMEYELANKIEPGDVQTLYGLGFCHWNLGDLEKAETVFREVLHIDPNYEKAQIGLAACLEE